MLNPRLTRERVNPNHPDNYRPYKKYYFLAEKPNLLRYNNNYHEYELHSCC